MPRAKVTLANVDHDEDVEKAKKHKDKKEFLKEVGKVPTKEKRAKAQLVPKSEVFDARKLLARKYQSDVVVAGWRGAVDPIWRRCYWVNPFFKISTFDMREVLKVGGMEDLLQSGEWALYVVDPSDYPTVYADETWSFGLIGDTEVFSWVSLEL